MPGLPHDRTLRVCQVSTGDLLGGAERVAWNLFQAYRARGHLSRLMVGRRRGTDSDVCLLAHDRVDNPWRRAWWRLYHALQPGARRSWWVRRMCRVVRGLAEPGGAADRWRGLEDFRYPGAWTLHRQFGEEPHVIHCHNLHGGYFDLRALPELSQRTPTVLTLHDAWLLAGHCAHSIDCERWLDGCGGCPDLSLYPAIRRDATAYNWERKRHIYTRCRLNVATPSRWLMDRVERSMLAPAIEARRVIPNGVDLSTFHPADQSEARAALGLPRDADILLFTAFGIRKNPWKDYETMRGAIAQAAERSADHRLIFVALGERGETQRIGRAEIVFVPMQDDPNNVARHYQAADIYLHAAKADTFPNSVLEALACGTPVIATAVGGISEQVKPLVQGARDTAPYRYFDDAEATGALVPAGDAEAMADAVVGLLSERRLLRLLGANAARDARRRFDVERQADAYLDWYREILEGRRIAPSVDHGTGWSNKKAEAFFGPRPGGKTAVDALSDVEAGCGSLFSAAAVRDRVH